MNVATAIYRNGRLELTSSVDSPDGTPVEVKPVESAGGCRVGPHAHALGWSKANDDEIVEFGPNAENYGWSS